MPTAGTLMMECTKTRDCAYTGIQQNNKTQEEGQPQCQDGEGEKRMGLRRGTHKPLDICKQQIS